VFGTFGVDLTTRKTAVKPGDDFFAYMNGQWLDNFPIPADKASYGVAEKLDDEARANVRKIIEEAAASKAASGSVEQKIGDFYASFMDTARIESAGIKALKPDLDHIAAAKSVADLSRLFGEPGYQSPIGVYVGPDDKNPDAYLANVVQSGLGLPDRDYYLKDDPKLKEIRAAYQAHIARMLMLAGVDDAAGKAARIMALETKIARAHWAAERTRDAIANYNPKNRAAVIAFAPGLDWPAMFEAMSNSTDVSSADAAASPSGRPDARLAAKTAPPGGRCRTVTSKPGRVISASSGADASMCSTGASSRLAAKIVTAENGERTIRIAGCGMKTASASRSGAIADSRTGDSGAASRA